MPLDMEKLRAKVKAKASAPGGEGEPKAGGGAEESEELTELRAARAAIDRAIAACEKRKDY